MIYQRVHHRTAALTMALALGLGVLPADAALAQDGTDPDFPGAGLSKPAFDSWHATPRALLRDMRPDRPDKTEGPYTVAPGRFQAELDLVSHTRTRDTAGANDTRSTQFAVAPVNLKVGLTRNLDVEVVLEPYDDVRITERPAGEIRGARGFGAVTARAKVNFWGNDGGASALGAIPYVRWPSGLDRPGGKTLEGGMLIPLALKLPRGWSAGAMTGLDIRQGETGGGRHASFINSITFGHALRGDWGGYAEFYTEVSAAGGSGWVGTADFGVTYALRANLQIDAGMNIGATRAADSLNLFTGLAWRF
jgi:hypothetical protein